MNVLLPAVTLWRREVVRFLRQPNRVFTRDQLLDHAWQDPGAVTDRTIDAHVKSIRAKLRAAKAGAEDFIQTRRGLGYLFAFFFEFPVGASQATLATLILLACLAIARLRHGRA